MRKSFAVFALAAASVQPALAVTFPSLTTIYVAAGVLDQGGAPGTGVATTVYCANVSGQTAQVRVLILDNEGEVAAASRDPGARCHKKFLHARH